MENNWIKKNKKEILPNLYGKVSNTRKRTVNIRKDYLESHNYPKKRKDYKNRSNVYY